MFATFPGPHSTTFITVSLVYFGHSRNTDLNSALVQGNDFWTSTVGACKLKGPFGRLQAIVDMWDTDGPSGLNGTSSCGRVDQRVDAVGLKGCSTCFSVLNDPIPYVLLQGSS